MNPPAHLVLSALGVEGYRMWPDTLYHAAAWEGDRRWFLEKRGGEGQGEGERKVRLSDLVSVCSGSAPLTSVQAEIYPARS